MKPVLPFSILITIFACNNKVDKSINEKKQIEPKQNIITIIEPTETNYGRIQGGFDGCGYNYSLNEDTISIYHPRQRELNQIHSILRFSGLSSNFKVFGASIKNAVATIINGERYIFYDPILLSYSDNQSGSYWSSMSILAHEIGHHLSGHTLLYNGSNPYQEELEADKYSGFILYKLGASLNQAIAAIIVLGSEQASNTHPSKADRIKAISSGWNEANQQRFDSALPPPPSDDISQFSTYTYDMLIEEKNIKEGIISEEDYFNYDFFYGIIRDVKIVDHQVESFKVYVKKTGPNWKNSVGSLDGETIDVSLDDYWYSIKAAQIHCKSLPYLLVPGRRIKFSFVEGLYGGTAESGYLRLTYVKGLKGNSF